MSFEIDDRLVRLVGDALDRVERGHAAFIPFTPTLASVSIVAAVERLAAERALAVATRELDTGIHVARWRG
jgi:hypothetical protein